MESQAQTGLSAETWILKRRVANYSIALFFGYAALSNLRSSASHSATRSDTSQSRFVTPAAIAGARAQCLVNLDEIVGEVSERNACGVVLNFFAEAIR